jgi:hypothetical protein
LRMFASGRHSCVQEWCGHVAGRLTREREGAQRKCPPSSDNVSSAKVSSCGLRSVVAPRWAIVFVLPYQSYWPGRTQSLASVAATGLGCQTHARMLLAASERIMKAN